MVAKYSLLIFQTDGLQDRSDFETIKSLMHVRHPDIDCQVYTIRLTPDDLYRVENDDWHVWPVSLSIDMRAQVLKDLSSRPTLMFSPVPLELHSDIRGHRLFARHLPKHEEMSLLAAKGFPVPTTLLLNRNAVQETSRWGPLVVVKPASGRGGRGIRLMKALDLHQVLSRQEDGRCPQMLVQQWIDTGPYINSYRAMTVLDGVIYIYRSEVIDPSHVDEGSVGPEGINVSSNGQPRRLLMDQDSEVFALAQRICNAFTFTCTLGIDIIRDVRTKKLYVVELNSGFPTWHLSSRYIHNFERNSGYFSRDDLYSQFGALDSITESLARVVRRLAC